MFANKVIRNTKKNNSSRNDPLVLTENEGYDHYIALDWSERNMAIARLGKKDTEPKIIREHSKGAVNHSQFILKFAVAQSGIVT